MLSFSVRKERCGGCGLCVRDCPSRIIGLDSNKLPCIAPEDEEKCIQCQHCLVICPKGAISIFKKDPDNGMSLSAEKLPKVEEMSLLMRGRRSVRHYRDENVDPELLKQLLATVANAPTGRNNRSLTFTVIDDRETMDWFRKETMQRLEKLSGEGRIPPELAFLRNVVAAYNGKQGDGVFRGAPHVLIVSAEPTAPCPTEDVAIALSYFELLAQSAGLGTVWCGILKWVLDLIPELRTLIGIEHGDPLYTMLFGYPAIHFARTVQRDEAATINRVTRAQ